MNPFLHIIPTIHSKKANIFLFVFLILLAFNMHAQTSFTPNPNLEIRNARTMYSKTYLKGNGENVAIISTYPVHYQKNGAWEDINTTLTLDNGVYKNESNVIQSYFPDNITNSGKIKLVVNSNEIFIHSKKQFVLLDDQNNLTALSLSSHKTITTAIYNGISYYGIYDGIADRFNVFNGKIKNDVVLTSWPTLTLLKNISSGYFGFQETIELPQGWKITATDKSVNSLTSSSLSIVDSKGNPVLTIPEPIFFDNYKLQSDGSSMVEGKYLVQQGNNCWTLTTLVPVAWLKDVNTKYPISIDPTVIIAGTTGGWQSPNNFVDNPGFVFVGVCCGNLTHRAWIKFNTTGIPATSCITDVELQVTDVTENSTSPEVVLVNDVTGAFGPYGAITPAAYTDFGNGNYTSFTITGLGVYGYFPLGPAACALLQTQLPLGWFQPAFQFSNEPSTDWKNMSATSSNLEVTYNAPPCVLPIQLVSFNGNCDNGKVNLTWETATEINNKEFTIERTANDGVNHAIVGTVAGAGNSSQTLRYSFVDPNPLAGTSYYSLKQTDFDGQSKYVGLVAVTCDSTTEITIRPNPSAGKFIIKGAEQNSNVVVTDILGQVVFQTKITGEETQIDLSTHLNGMYFVQIISQNGPVSKKVILNK